MTDSSKIMEFLRMGQDPSPDCQIDEMGQTVSYICTDPLGNKLIWSTPFIEYNQQESVERLWRLCTLAYQEELDTDQRLSETLEKFQWPRNLRTGTQLFRIGDRWKIQYGAFSSMVDFPDWFQMDLPDILPDHYTLRKREDGGTDVLKNLPRA